LKLSFDGDVNHQSPYVPGMVRKRTKNQENHWTLISMILSLKFLALGLLLLSKKGIKVNYKPSLIVFTKTFNFTSFAIEKSK